MRKNNLYDIINKSLSYKNSCLNRYLDTFNERVIKMPTKELVKSEVEQYAKFCSVLIVNRIQII